MEGIITWSIFASWFFNRTLSINDDGVIFDFTDVSLILPK